MRWEYWYDSEWRGLGWTHEVIWSRVDVVQQLTPRRCPTAHQRTKDVVAVQRAGPCGAAAGERDEGRQQVRHVEHAVVPASILEDGWVVPEARDARAALRRQRLAALQPAICTARRHRGVGQRAIVAEEASIPNFLSKWQKHSCNCVS